MNVTFKQVWLGSSLAFIAVLYVKVDGNQVRPTAVSRTSAIQKALDCLKLMGKKVLKGDSVDARHDVQGDGWTVNFGQKERKYSVSISTNGMVTTFSDYQNRPDNPQYRSELDTTKKSALVLKDKVRAFLKRSEPKMMFSVIRMQPSKRSKSHSALVYQEYKGLPVRANFYGFEIRTSNAEICYFRRKWDVYKFEDKAKVRVDLATAKATIRTASKGRKPMQTTLFYHRLEGKMNEYLSEYARPVYIAEFGNWEEIWVDAETGKVVRNYKPQTR